MMEVLACGGGEYRLVDSSGNDVGWIRSTAIGTGQLTTKVIGFGGFATEAAARERAREGGRAIADFLERDFGVRCPELSEPSRLHGRYDSDAHWPAWDRVPAARLTSLDSAHDPARQLAIEFALPSFASADSVAVRAAGVGFDALDTQREPLALVHAEA